MLNSPSWGSVSYDVICYSNKLELSEPMMLEMEMWNRLNVNEEWLLQCCIKLMCTEWNCLNTFHSRCTGLFRNWNHSQVWLYWELSFQFSVLIQFWFSIWTLYTPYRLTKLTPIPPSLYCHQTLLPEYIFENVSQAAVSILDGCLLGINAMCMSVLEV